MTCQSSSKRKHKITRMQQSIIMGTLITIVTYNEVKTNNYAVKELQTVELFVSKIYC